MQARDRTCSVVLLFSVMSNLGLGFLVFRGFADEFTGRASPLPSQQRSDPSPVAAARSIPAWKSLEAMTPADLSNELVRWGISPAEARAIVAARLGEKESALWRELGGKTPEAPYWRPQAWPDFPWTNAMAFASLRTMSNEHRSFLNSRFGPDVQWQAIAAETDARLRFGNLPRETLDRVLTIEADYADLEAAGAAVARGVTLPGDRERQKFLRDEKERDLREVLSETEYYQYQLRSSPVADRIRRDFAAMDITESEYRAVYSILQDLEVRFVNNEATTPEARRERTEAEAKSKRDIYTALGPERTREYQQVTHSTYDQTAGLVEKLKLPAQNAKSLVQLFIESSAEASALRGDGSMRPADRLSRLQELQSRADASASGLLGGEDGMRAYRQLYFGRWIDQIVPPAAK